MAARFRAQTFYGTHRHRKNPRASRVHVEEREAFAELTDKRSLHIENRGHLWFRRDLWQKLNQKNPPSD
jgi:hypothetical protein